MSIKTHVAATTVALREIFGRIMARFRQGRLSVVREDKHTNMIEGEISNFQTELDISILLDELRIQQAGLVSEVAAFGEL